MRNYERAARTFFPFIIHHSAFILSRRQLPLTFLTSDANLSVAFPFSHRPRRVPNVLSNRSQTAVLARCRGV